MKNDCLKWKEPLLDAALTDTTAPSLQDHLLVCADCARELAALRVRREQLDALLPRVARGAEPAPDFQARLSAAIQDRHVNKNRWFQPWPVLAVATPLVAGALVFAAMTVWKTNIWKTRQTAPGPELAVSEKLAHWRAPSDVLLATPGQDILRTMPALGGSYLKFPVKTDKEK